MSTFQYYHSRKMEKVLQALIRMYDLANLNQIPCAQFFLLLAFAAPFPSMNQVQTSQASDKDPLSELRAIDLNLQTWKTNGNAPTT